MFHDPSALRLGRKPPRHDPRTLKLSNYVRVLPDVPPMRNWGEVVSSWGMMANDRIGDCAFASAGHVIVLHTAANKAPVVPSDQDIIAAYSAVTGYKPDDPNSDTGTVEIDALNYWRKTGIAGHKILAFAAINPRDLKMVRQAVYLFGAVYAGVSLPINAQHQGIWQLDGVPTGDSAPGSWGGHAIPLVGYDTAAFACVTWGQVKWMTAGWLSTYCDEAYAVVSEDWAPPAGLAPNSFNLDQLKTDLAEITKGD